MLNIGIHNFLRSAARICKIKPTDENALDTISNEIQNLLASLKQVVDPTWKGSSFEPSDIEKPTLEFNEFVLVLSSKLDIPFEKLQSLNDVKSEEEIKELTNLLLLRLFKYLSKNNINISEMLLTPNPNGVTPLIFASEYNIADSLACAFENGLNPLDSVFELEHRVLKDSSDKSKAEFLVDLFVRLNLSQEEVDRHGEHLLTIISKNSPDGVEEYQINDQVIFIHKQNGVVFEPISISRGDVIDYALKTKNASLLQICMCSPIINSLSFGKRIEIIQKFSDEDINWLEELNYSFLDCNFKVNNNSFIRLGIALSDLSIFRFQSFAVRIFEINSSRKLPNSAPSEVTFALEQKLKDTSVSLNFENINLLLQKPIAFIKANEILEKRRQQIIDSKNFIFLTGFGGEPLDFYPDHSERLYLLTRNFSTQGNLFVVRAESYMSSALQFFAEASIFSKIQFSLESVFKELAIWNCSDEISELINLLDFYKTRIGQLEIIKILFLDQEVIIKNPRIKNISSLCRELLVKLSLKEIVDHVLDFGISDKDERKLMLIDDHLNERISLLIEIIKIKISECESIYGFDLAELIDQTEQLPKEPREKIYDFLANNRPIAASQAIKLNLRVYGIGYAHLYLKFIANFDEIVKDATDISDLRPLIRKLNDDSYQKYLKLVLESTDFTSHTAKRTTFDLFYDFVEHNVLLKNGATYSDALRYSRSQYERLEETVCQLINFMPLDLLSEVYSKRAEVERNVINPKTKEAYRQRLIREEALSAIEAAENPANYWSLNSLFNAAGIFFSALNEGKLYEYSPDHEVEAMCFKVIEDREKCNQKQQPNR